MGVSHKAGIAFRVALLSVLLSSGASMARADDTAVLEPREIVERSGGAVVMIEAKSEGQISQGSGFFVGDGNAVVTNLHVIDGADEVAIMLRDGTRFDDIAVRAFDVERDLVVLVVESAGNPVELPSVEFGDPSTLDPGAKIVVIGNPLGLEQTVTEGIVSAWRDPPDPSTREPDSEESSRLLLPPCRLLQISAAISSGSSGGPVFNDRGQVIGVATAGVLRGAAGLNFAVPVDELPALLDADDGMDLVTLRERADTVRLELARPHFENAKLAFERGEGKKTERHLERALQLFPGYEEALLLSGRIALANGRIDLAEQRFTDALKSNENSAEAWYRLGEVHHLRGSANDDDALITEAEAAYRASLDNDGRHAGAAFGLAQIYAARGLADEAERFSRMAIDSDQGLTDAHYLLGEIHFSRDEMVEARKSFERALWEDPEHALSHYGLAKLFTVLDRQPHGIVSPYGDAPKHWEEFLRLSEGDPALAKQRELALRLVRQHYPDLIER